MRRYIVATAVGTALLAGCADEPTEFTGTRLETPYQAPDTELTDTSGEPYSLTADTEKPLTLVFFGYTHCPDYCPLVMNSISAALNRLDDEQRDQVDVVFVTTDPARDDEQALRSYLDGYGEDFVGLTGRLSTIVEVAEPLHLYVNDGKRLPTGGYDLGGHSTYTLGITEDDEAVAIWDQDTTAVEFANDIETLLDEA